MKRRKEHHYLGVGTMFGFGKKKKQSLPELPPPPSPPEFPMPSGDIPEIRPREIPEAELPEIPAPEEKPIELPEAPSPEMPEAPKVEETVPPLEEVPAEPVVPEETHEVSEIPAEVEVPEKVRMPVGPAFVAVDEYNKIMESSNRVRAKLAEADEFMHRLNEIKAEEEKAFDKWRSHLEEIERKLSQIDRVIARAKR
ncbi:MAG: hypothetical protein QXR48_02835 [Candidatus Woesearchaeota archaeon]